nr:hypothetical protein GCM10020092_033050 [Actinoplanes digitatis]
MTATTPSALDLAVEINRVTAGTGGSSCPLDELWAPIRVVVPFEAAWLGVFDTGRNRYQTLTAVGHDAVNRAYLESSDFNEQVEAFGLFPADPSAVPARRPGSARRRYRPGLSAGG